MTKTGKIVSITALSLTLLFVAYIIYYALQEVSKNGASAGGGFSLNGTPGVVGASDIIGSDSTNTNNQNDSQNSVTNTGNLVDIGITGTQKYAPGSLVSITDANTIYDHFVSLGFSTITEPLNIDGVVQNSNQASLQTINLVHASGLLMPAGLTL